MFAEKRYIEFAIVLAVNSNNPTILNPDFLKYNKIVDESFVLSQPPICTEPFAQLPYKNGITITSQLDKVIFSARMGVEDKQVFEDICDIAKKYATLIPHVEYTGVGINPMYLIKFDGAVKSEEFVLNNFLKIKKIDTKVFNAGLNLGFSLNEQTVCNVKIKSGKGTASEKNQEVIVVNANFHHELRCDIDTKVTKVTKMTKIIESYQSDIDFFEKNVIELYFEEGKL